MLKPQNISACMCSPFVPPPHGDPLTSNGHERWFVHPPRQRLRPPIPRPFGPSPSRAPRSVRASLRRKDADRRTRMPTHWIALKAGASSGSWTDIEATRPLPSARKRSPMSSTRPSSGESFRPTQGFNKASALWTTASRSTCVAFPRRRSAVVRPMRAARWWGHSSHKRRMVHSTSSWRIAGTLGVSSSRTRTRNARAPRCCWPRRTTSPTSPASSVASKLLAER
mmetsp:Transcript_25932/g.55172  ORF Transcript_25932/g.55172 Transcript_25932/m.55172 type:complete len:225 (+) Transcript_25932:3-677(+)